MSATTEDKYELSDFLAWMFIGTFLVSLLVKTKGGDAAVWALLECAGIALIPVFCIMEAISRRK